MPLVNNVLRVLILKERGKSPCLLRSLQPQLASLPPPPPLTKLLELSTIANFTFDLFSPWSVSPESLQVQVFDSCHVANFRPSETVFHLPVVSSLDSLGKRISGFSMFRENYSQTLCRLLFLSVSHARVQRSPRSPLLSTYALSIRFGALCKSF